MKNNYRDSAESLTSNPKRFDFSLEALRGFAALIVVLGHILSQKFSLDSTYTPTGDWVNPLPGHSSVLIFFILSGYVIGLTNRTALTSKTIIYYLRKRLIRLYPIYAISLFVALFASDQLYPISVVLGHFLFLQNVAFPTMYENGPLWSLNYEVLYYLAFIPVSYFGLNLGRVCIAAALMGLIFATILPLPLTSSYCLGFVFWTSGLWLAQTKSSYFIAQISSNRLLFALIALFLGYEFLNPFTTALITISDKINIIFKSPTGPHISFGDVLQIPFYFYVFLHFTNQTTKNSKLFLFLIILSCFAYYAHIISKYGFLSSQSFYLLIPFFFFVMGTVTLISSWTLPASVAPVRMPTIFIKLGAISYGIYAIHFPISIILSRINFINGTMTTFMVRVLIDLCLVISIGYLLELKLQPWFKANFDKKPFIYPLEVT